MELLVTFFLSFLMLKEKGIISTCFKFSADLPRKSWEITFSACRSGKRSLNACLRYIFHFLITKFEPRFDLMKKDAKIAHFLYGAPYSAHYWNFQHIVPVCIWRGKRGSFVNSLAWNQVDTSLKTLSLDWIQKVWVKVNLGPVKSECLSDVENV